MQRDEVAGSLRQLLADQPDQDKRRLLTGLMKLGFIGLTASSINSVLYTHRDLFVSDGGTPPLWRLAAIDEATPRRAAPIPAAAAPVTYIGREPRAWQQEALAAWRQAGRRGVIEAVTGTGKTTVGVLAAAQALEAGDNVLVLVPGLELMTQWHEVLRRDLAIPRVGRCGDGYADELSDHQIVVATMQHASRNYMLPTGAAGLVIADEVHRCGAESFALALEPEFRARLGLTATLERDDDGLTAHVAPFFGGVVATCSYDRGLADGILAPFRVGFLGVDFTADERIQYDEHDERARKLRRRLITSHGCTDAPFGEFMADVQRLAEGGLGVSRPTKDARNYLHAFSKRRQILADTGRKQEALAVLAPLLSRAERGLVFTETKASAQEAAETLQAHSVAALDFTSDLRREERLDRMSRFRDGTIRVLAAPRVLDEGVDVPQADVGVILATSRSKRQMIQRMGRVIRPKADGRSATFVVVYVRGRSEDPKLGAHEAFLDQLIHVAEDRVVFDPDTTSAELLAWHLDE